MNVAQAGVVITARTGMPEWQALGLDLQALAYEDLLAQQPDEGALAAVREQARALDPLYCNFTSGSTGVPKGVVVSHRSVIDFMNYFPDLFRITGEDVLGGQAPLDFDVSVKDIYTTLKTGATLVLIPRRMFSVVTELLDYICAHRVTTLIWAVSALCLVAQFRGFTYRVPETVNKVLFSGEQMPAKFLRQWQHYLPDAAYVNLYGPTEITCNCTYYRVGPPGWRRESGSPSAGPFPMSGSFCWMGRGGSVTAPGVQGEALRGGHRSGPGLLERPGADRPGLCARSAQPPLPGDHLPHRRSGLLPGGRPALLCGAQGFSDQAYGPPD